MRFINRAVIGALCMAFALAIGTARADVRLPRLISDNMVIQCDRLAPIYGWASPGENVSVTLNDQTLETQAGADGRWQVKMGPFHFGGPYELKVAGNNTLTVKNVLVGEVWVCCGQSNLVFRLSECTDWQKEAETASYPQMRFFVVDRDVASKPLEDLATGQWTVCSPRTAPGFSALGYFFGRDIHKALNVPVGLIQTGVTDSRVEFYMSPKALKSNPEFGFVYERWNRWKKSVRWDEDGWTDAESNMHDIYQDQYAGLRPAMQRWTKAVAEAKAAGATPPPEPKWMPWRIFKNYPSGQYFSMCQPLMRYAIRGVMWHQGEGNATEATLFGKLFPVLIQSWREEWNEGNFPFIFVQAPKMPGGPDWPELRDVELKTLGSMPNVGMAVTHDLEVAPNEDMIHTPHKEPFGQRLALIALGMVYGQKVAYCGPLYKEAVREGNAMRVRFDHIEGGLKSQDGQALREFIIAGVDQKFWPATAVIENNTLLISSPKVAAPVAVRYCWLAIPHGNLVNGAGLPASPFRSDDWPGVTTRDITDVWSNEEQVESCIRRYLEWNLPVLAESSLYYWSGDPAFKAQWIVRIAKEYRAIGQPDEAKRAIAEARAEAEKVENAEAKAKALAVYDAAQ